MNNVFKRLLIAAVLCYLAVPLYLVLFQRSIIYKPVPRGEDNPLNYGAPYEEIRFKNGAGHSLSGWWLKHSETDPIRPILLYCHGNAASLSMLADVARIFYSYGWDTFMFDYRGYGASEGGPISEIGFAEDALAAHKWIKENEPGRKVVIWGHSLGAAVASKLARAVNPAGLVMEGGFPSVMEVAKLRYPWVPIFPFMIFDKFDNLSYVKDRSYPVLIMQAEKDTICPPSFGKRIFDAASEPKTWLLVEGINHNGFPSVHELYSERLRQMVAEWVK